MINSLTDDKNYCCSPKHLYIYQCIDLEMDKSVTPPFSVCYTFLKCNLAPAFLLPALLLSGLTHSTGMWDTLVQYTLPYTLRPSVRF